MPPETKLPREEPDAGNLHVRVCEGRGWQHPRLLGHLCYVPADTHPPCPSRGRNKAIAPYVLYKMLRERGADLAVSLLTGPFEQDDLAAEILYSDSLAVVAAPDSTWVRRRTVALAQLVDEPWCLPTEGTVRVR